MRGVPAAALAGWWFGFGYFLAGLYWVGYAFLVDADIFGWLLPFAVTALPAGLALFTALGFALARLLWTGDAARVLALAASLTVAEWLRGHVLTGFPWNAFGYALSEPLALAQIASLIGLWGLTFLAVAIFASPAALIDRAAPGNRSKRRDRGLPRCSASRCSRRWRCSASRGSRASRRGWSQNVRLRIMQPNLHAGREIQLLRQGGGDAEISRAVGSRDRPRDHRRQGRHAS